MRWECDKLSHPLMVGDRLRTKEYAVDRAATLCWEAGVRYGNVNLGGDIKIIGPHPEAARGGSA